MLYLIALLLLSPSVTILITLRGPVASHRAAKVARLRLREVVVPRSSRPLLAQFKFHTILSPSHALLVRRIVFVFIQIFFIFLAYFSSSCCSNPGVTSYHIASR